MYHKSIASYSASKGPDYPAVPITKQAIANTAGPTSQGSGT